MPGLAGVRAGVAVQGVDFNPSSLVVSVSMVSMKGSLLKAAGTPSH